MRDAGPQRVVALDAAEDRDLERGRRAPGDALGLNLGNARMALNKAPWGCRRGGFYPKERGGNRFVGKLGPGPEC